jgi:hypothetical protein
MFPLFVLVKKLEKTEKTMKMFTISMFDRVCNEAF